MGSFGLCSHDVAGINTFHSGSSTGGVNPPTWNYASSLSIHTDIAKGPPQARRPKRLLTGFFLSSDHLTGNRKRAAAVIRPLGPSQPFVSGSRYLPDSKGPTRKEKVSTESDNPHTQEQELWDRITTTSGAERAEVLDELSHFAYKKNNYTEALQLVDTSIDIYREMGIDLYAPQLEHLYEGKALCHSNLGQNRESAIAFQQLAVLYKMEEKQSEYLHAQRASARQWFEAEEWQKSYDSHMLAMQEIDPDSDTNTQAMDLLNLGMALQKLNRDKEAIESLKAARNLFKSDKDPMMVNWCDRYLADSFLALGDGPEAHHHSQLYYNYSLVAEDLDMESYARYRLGQAFWLMKQYSEAQQQFVRSLELLTLDEAKDWNTIVKVNQQLAAALFAQGKNDEAKAILDRIAHIEETMNSGD